MTKTGSNASSYNGLNAAEKHLHRCALSPSKDTGSSSS